MMRNELFALGILALLLASAVSIAQEDDGYDEGAARQEAMETAERSMERIKKACMADMDSEECSCDILPEDIPASQCYQAMNLARGLVRDIKRSCLDDPDSAGCSCDRVPLMVQDECESTLSNVKRIALNLKEEIEKACYEDPYSSDCSCDEVPDDGKATCEAAISRALKEVDKRREEVIEQCQTDLELCSCERVPSKYREECKLEKASAEKIRTEMEGRCRSSPGACNCNTLEQGADECRKAKEEAMGIAKKAIIRIFDECFQDVTVCNCRALFEKHLSREYEDSILYCEEQRSYGLNCMRAGLDCDRMDADKIIPADVPDILKPFVKQSLESKIEKEKKKGVRAAMQVITRCLENPAECDCSQTPIYAQEFCEHKKGLQIQCFNDDYTACVEIDAEPIVPDYLPEFSRGLITALVQKLKDAQKGIVLASASKKVGDAILDCMDSAATCDCSVAPEGKFRAFCERKKELIGQCREERILDACFTLDQEPVMPEGVPDIIMNHIEKNVMPTIDEKKQAIFDEMRGDQCGGMTLPQCKEWCDANECTI